MDMNNLDLEWRPGNWRMEAELMMARTVLGEGAVGERPALEDVWRPNLVEKSDAEDGTGTGEGAAVVRKPEDDGEDRMGTPAEAGETSTVRAGLQEAGERWVWMGWGNLIAGCSQSAVGVEAAESPGPCSR